MSLPPYQQQVFDFVTEHGLHIPPSDRLLDLVSEVGELAKEVLKATRYSRQPFNPAEEWTAELGDVFFALSCLANSTGVDLNVALADALHKYQERLLKRSDAGSGS